MADDLHKSLYFPLEWFTINSWIEVKQVIFQFFPWQSSETFFSLALGADIAALVCPPLHRIIKSLKNQLMDEEWSQQARAKTKNCNNSSKQILFYLLFKQANSTEITNLCLSIQNMHV